MASDPIVKEIYIDAPPAVVFEFLTDPVKMIRWMGLRAEIAPRRGGIYRLDPNGRDVILGKYIEVVPNARVVFTWGWEEAGRNMPAGSTQVEIDLTPEGKGTRLRLIHRELPPEIRDKSAMGWAHYLNRLKTVCEGGEPGPDPYADPSVRHG
ncbi:MAG TPA: SRPBCC domain-containing protein [Candidatus Acidoferrales bacterium]|nr:SRPBCC domain-containing protein [Candidatus Acidoferrales bacterium]